MNKLLLNLMLVVVIASCSQQKYAFRKTIKVKETEQAAVIPKKQIKVSMLDQQKQSVIAEQVAVLSTPQLADVYPANTQQITASISASTPDITIQKEWINTKVVQADLVPHQTKKTFGDGGGLAIAGFVLALVGIFFAAVPFGILAIIFGILSLRSSRRGLAIAALVIGILDVVLGAIAISKLS
jgi:hypothetical protein